MCVERERERGRGRKGKEEEEKREGVENINNFTTTESRGPKTASGMGPCLLGFFLFLFLFFFCFKRCLTLPTSN